MRKKETFQLTIIFKVITFLLVAVFCFAPVIVTANQEIKVTCSSIPNGAECQIEAGNKKALDIFELSSPRRLVIDVGLTGSETPSSSIELNNISEVIAVRSGEHPDKVRLVFDLRENAGQLAWKQQDYRTIIRFSSNHKSEVKQGKNYFAAADIPNKDLIVIEKEPLLTVPAKDVRASQQRTSLNIFQGHKPSGQVCTHVEFVEDDGPKRAFIRLSLSEYPQFSFAKASDRSYRVRVPNANVATAELKQPFFPPHNFPGVAFVELQQDKADLIVLIGVERGTTLNAVAKDDTLLIEVAE